MTKDNTQNKQARRLPDWLKIRVGSGIEREEVRQLLSELRLNTVCQSAICPNMCECWQKRTATFMILGNSCTRNCRFCAVEHGHAEMPDVLEPQHVAEAVKRLDLKFAVITSVTRDDLPDGGSAHFAAVIQAIRQNTPAVGIEVLVPDFLGCRESILTVLQAQPEVVNHNIETCRRLTADIRSGADYDRSLGVLRFAAEFGNNKKPSVKSGMMLGLGETDEEITDTITDLYAAGVKILTLGQYLPPSKAHWPVDRYVTPEEFELWGDKAKQIGFKAVASAPFVRSSYMAESFATAAKQSG